MAPTLKSYLQVFPILWWCGLLLIASAAVALFPFDNMSFAYLIKPNVLAVIGNTLGIGVIILSLEFWVGYQIFISGFWQRAVGRAILIHALGGVALPATIAFGLILLVYPATIVDDHRFQWDILFMLLLLVILNYWLANRMLRYQLDSSADSKQKLISDRDRLLQQIEFLRTEIAHYKNDAQQYELLAARTDKTVNGLIEGKNILTLELHELRMENSRQLKRVQQLEDERNVEIQARIQAETRSQQLLLEIAECRASPHQNSNAGISHGGQSDVVFHFKVNGAEIAIFEQDIAYCYGHHRKGEDSFQEIVLMDGTKYHPALKSLSDLLRIFPTLKHISRNYLISGQAIVKYEMLRRNTPLLTVLHLRERIEYGESYRRKQPGWKNWLAGQTAINQKKIAAMSPEQLPLEEKNIVDER
ncbi:hypothetical protein BWD42_23970 [Sphingobacterium sp. CZ-UAM]|uniref:hypothetical protein n=1 Tax=Sphingobacterium sp. CZ-UAM TaxID=1933868 RepID=UPI00098665D0|nr:hypothetical protein [Sphingobacterium sp. CZ-UAM]OOG15741.1 hypothetical protein BWD42_23970 [Sphingobacterium sp. CZ-UAM]